MSSNFSPEFGAIVENTVDFHAEQWLSIVVWIPNSIMFQREAVGFFPFRQVTRFGRWISGISIQFHSEFRMFVKWAQYSYPVRAKSTHNCVIPFRISLSSLVGSALINRPSAIGNKYCNSSAWLTPNSEEKHKIFKFIENRSLYFLVHLIHLPQ